MMLPRRAPLPPELNRLRYRTLGAAYRVHTELGPSLREPLYTRCLAHALRNDGLNVETEVRLDLEFEGLKLEGALRMDIVVQGTIVIEVKVGESHHPVWDAQLLSYLGHSGLPLGYVINFRVPHLRQGIRPFVNLPLPVEDRAPQRESAVVVQDHST